MSFETRSPGEVDPGPEREVIRIAAAQDGVVATWQLLRAGLSKPAITHRIGTGLLQRVHRGVYAYGALMGPWWAEWAAVLACGVRAALSHATGLALVELADRPAIVHVTRPSTGHRHRGVLVHRATLEPHEITLRHGLPVTTPARTLADVASSMPLAELARLIEEAQIRRLVTRSELEAMNRVPNLRAALARDHEPSLTRSEAERRMLALIRAARLPPPVTNVRVGRHEVDMLWRDHRLVVEIDGFEFHSSRPAFERDRVRDAELQALGYRVLRITWRRLVDEPEAVVALLAAALSAARSA
jgi:very-short-patch-repair endonuclease